MGREKRYGTHKIQSNVSHSLTIISSNQSGKRPLAHRHQTRYLPDKHDLTERREVGQEKMPKRKKDKI
jgi:hypothetical protein